MERGMDFVDMLGWLGAALTLSVYSMRTMLPLRAMAVAANITFIAFGYFGEIWPTFALHALLLPLNAARFFEILVTLRRVRAVRQGEPALDWLDMIKTTRNCAAGTQVFRLGDTADKLYYVKSGSVRMVEIGKLAGAGDLFGEIAFFTEDRRRTATAICESDCEILEIDEGTFTQLFYQNPAFGLFMTRLVAGRLASATEELRHRPIAG